jgi:hypothetical protein
MRTRADAERYVREEAGVRAGKLSQRARLIRLLLSAPEIGLPSILELQIAQFGARIKELRDLGFDIKNRTASINGQTHSWYRLAFDAPAVPPAFPPATPNSGDWYEREHGSRPAESAPDLGPLFGGSTP